MKTRFILINTSHAGNVGAAARAMKTMGFEDLVLVAPRWANVLRREETIQRASGALNVLENARIVATLDEALDGISHLCATAMTPRDFGPPTRSPREHFELLLKSELPALTDKALEPDLIQSSQNAGIAFLFGSERFGMTNEDVYRCHVALSIPTNPTFGSLNLGAAIQVIAHEWRTALGGFGDGTAAPANATSSSDATGDQGVKDGQGVQSAQGAQNAQNVQNAQGERTVLADAAQVAGMLAHWERALVDIGFLDPAAPKKLMPRLNQLFNRAQLGPEEIHILRGVAKAMIETAQAKR